MLPVSAQDPLNDPLRACMTPSSSSATSRASGPTTPDGSDEALDDTHHANA